MQKGDETKERIKDVSRELFHRRGYGSTSINDILDSSGVKKGNLYFHYQSKENLIIEVLKESLTIYETQINAGIEHMAAADQIDSIIEAITDYHVNGDITKGCMFGNMALEIGHDGSEISNFVEGVFKRWEERFEDLLNRAVEKGEIRLKEPAIVLARMILASIEGGVLMSKISGRVEPLTDCTRFIRTVLDERRIR
ncbi:MAG TPA: TetR/AcrR family transcriptional regulator [Spirochaetota bacterium]|nr:TetR/AcrR family transcriptional regulator [Spirochaetota bacterium]